MSRHSKYFYPILGFLFVLLLVISWSYFSGYFKQNQDNSSGHTDLASNQFATDSVANSHSTHNYVPSQNEINRVFLRMDMSEGLSPLGRNIVAHYQRIVDPDLAGFHAPLSTTDVVRMCEEIVNSPICQEVPPEDQINCAIIAEDENKSREAVLGVKEGASNFWTDTTNMFKGMWDWLFGTDMQEKKAQVKQATQPFVNMYKDNYKKWLERQSMIITMYPNLTIAMAATGETLGEFGYVVGQSIKEAMVGAIDRFPCLSYRQKWASLTQFSGEIGTEFALETATFGMIGPILAARRGLTFVHKSSKHFADSPQIKSASSELDRGQHLEMVPENDIPALDNPRIQIERGRGQFDEGFWISDNSLIAMRHQLDQAKADFYLAMIRDKQWYEEREAWTKIVEQQESIRDIALIEKLLEKSQNLLLETTTNQRVHTSNLVGSTAKNTPLEKYTRYYGRGEHDAHIFKNLPHSTSANTIAQMVQQRNQLKHLFESGPLAKVIDEPLRTKIRNSEYINDKFIIDTHNIIVRKDKNGASYSEVEIRMKNHESLSVHGKGDSWSLSELKEALDSQDYYTEVNEAVEKIGADDLKRIFEDEDQTSANELIKLIDNDTTKFKNLAENFLQTPINIKAIIDDIHTKEKIEKPNWYEDRNKDLSVQNTLNSFFDGGTTDISISYGSSFYRSKSLEDLISNIRKAEAKSPGAFDLRHFPFFSGTYHSSNEFIEAFYERIRESINTKIYSHIIKELLQNALNHTHLVSEVLRHNIFINGFAIEKEILRQSQELTHQLALRYDELIENTKVMDLRSEDIRNLHTTIQNLEASTNERLNFIKNQDGILEITQ